MPKIRVIIPQIKPPLGSVKGMYYCFLLIKTKIPYTTRKIPIIRLRFMCPQSIMTPTIMATIPIIRPFFISFFSFY